VGSSLDKRPIFTALELSASLSIFFAMMAASFLINGGSYYGIELTDITNPFLQAVRGDEISFVVYAVVLLSLAFLAGVVLLYILKREGLY
jgi:hypothetical protein